MSQVLSVAAHPLLALEAFAAEFPTPIGSGPSPAWLAELLSLDAEAPIARTEDVRQAVRQLLRHGGYKPTGRGKPASEYLVRAASEGALASINVAVDLCNAVSLASGLPISVVDLDLLEPPLRVSLGEPDASYVFNASGQEIALAGLLCLGDAQGPCANAVKDSQRTKTHAGTTRTLAVVWGSKALPAEHLERAARWYRELHERAGARLGDVNVDPRT